MAWNWVSLFSGLVTRIPIERILFPPPDPTKELEKFAATVGSTTTQKEAAKEAKPTVITLGEAKPPEIATSPQLSPELALPPRPLTPKECIACLAHNHYLAARGRIKEAIKFYERESGFTETVLAKLDDVMEDLITPQRDDYAARSPYPLVNKMLHDMQKRGDDIKKELEAVVLDYEHKTITDLYPIRDKIIDIQKAARHLTGIEKEMARGKRE